MKPTIGIRELKNQASKIVRSVREDQHEVVITHQGKPVAVIRPFTPEDHAELTRQTTQNTLDNISKLAWRITDSWVSDSGAVELVEKQRR